MSAGRIVAVLGAESTGKTTLVRELHAALQAAGHRVARVDEHLREFCAARGRTPKQDEQHGIAQEQQRRIEAAAATHGWVLADTTPLQTAIYSRLVFGDAMLQPAALQFQARCACTLLTALDLPWKADGIQRDGPQVRVPVDALLRDALHSAGLGFSVVHGSGTVRTEQALAVLRGLKAEVGQEESAAPRLQPWCERCGDAACERHALRLR